MPQKQCGAVDNLGTNIDWAGFIGECIWWMVVLTFVFLFHFICVFGATGVEICFLLTGAYGPEYWSHVQVSAVGPSAVAYIDISDQHARVSEEYQDLQLIKPTTSLLTKPG